MKIISLYFISLCARFSTYVAAAPPIVPPSLTLLDENIPINLTDTSTAHNLSSNPHPSNSPPHPPFFLSIPNFPLRLNVYYVRYIPTRTESWVRAALRIASGSCAHYPSSQSISRSLRETVVHWNGNPDLTSIDSTDIRLEPNVRLTWGMLAEIVGVMRGFVVSFPGWDLGYEIEVLGEAGNIGKCTLLSRWREVGVQG